MTIQTEVTQPDVYNCDGTTTVFATSFKILDETQIGVNRLPSGATVETTLQLGVDYTVQIFTNNAQITTTTAYPNGDKLSLYLTVPRTQTVDYTNNDPFDAETTEAALDKLTLIAQDLTTFDSTCMIFPSTDTGDKVLPPATERAVKLLGFDTNGEPIAVVSGRAQVATPMSFQIVAGQTDYPLTYQVTSGDDLLVYTQGQWFLTSEYSVVDNGNTLRLAASVNTNDLNGSTVQVRYIGNALLTGQVADGAINREEVFADNVTPLRSFVKGTAGTLIGYDANGDAAEVGPPYIVGEIKMCSYVCNEPGWLPCDGAEVSRTTYSDLFGKIGTTYGPGDGSTTFNLPNQSGRSPVGIGRGNTGVGGGLGTNRALGASFGAEAGFIGINHMPPHDHDGKDGSSGTNGYLGGGAGAPTAIKTGSTGGGEAFPIQSPGLALYFIIYTGVVT